jgi:drug/metabolite transporter (DMT)-like permease
MADEPTAAPATPDAALPSAPPPPRIPGRSPHRTLYLSIFVLLLLTGTFLYAVNRTPPPDAQVVALFAALCSTASWIIVAVATKGGAESVSHIATYGTGLKGIAQTLFTDRKPGEPPAEKKP